jgi:DNA-binding transcriptional regulator YiaG
MDTLSAGEKRSNNAERDPLHNGIDSDLLPIYAMLYVSPVWQCSKKIFSMARIRKSRPRRGSEIGLALRAWRKRNRLSQSQAALKLKVSRRTLQEWEQGRATPRHLALETLREKIG